MYIYNIACTDDNKIIIIKARSGSQKELGSNSTLNTNCACLGKCCAEDTTASSCPWLPGWYVQRRRHRTFDPSSFSAKRPGIGRPNSILYQGCQSLHLYVTRPQGGAEGQLGPAASGDRAGRAQRVRNAGNGSYTQELV